MAVLENQLHKLFILRRSTSNICITVEDGLICIFLCWFSVNSVKICAPFGRKRGYCPQKQLPGAERLATFTS